MSDAAKCKELIKRYCAARIPFISFDTIERPRALDILTEVSEELDLPFFVHTLSKGVCDLETEKVLNDDKSVYGAIDFMSDQMKRKEDLTLILTSAPDLSGDNAESKQMLALVNLASERGGTIIVLTNGAVWNQLQRQGMIVKLDLPNEEEMYAMVKEDVEHFRKYFKSMESDAEVEWDDSDIRQAAAILTGVTGIEALNVIAALAAKGGIKKSDMEEVTQAKDRLFSDISGLERITVDDSVKSVGGLSGLRRWLDEKKELLTPEKRAVLKQQGLQPPRGILLVGVPGCGKSLSAKAIAASWKLPLYRLDFATVQGGIVGQTEQQLRDALSIAESVSPCVLWIDEIEKGLSGVGSTGDGGVSTRMVGQFLFWLQECKKPVFVVATANDVSMLPSELLRRGRFDELFFVDLPTEDERREILTLYMRKYLKMDFSGALADKIVAQTEGFTGADLEYTLRDLGYHIIANKEFVLSEENITLAFDNVIPLSQTSPEKIEAIREWGMERAVPASGKPIGSEEISKRDGRKKRRVVI